MRDIIISMKDESKVELSELMEGAPIFAYMDGELRGMIVQDTSQSPSNGWILKIGGKHGAYGYFGSRKECLQHGVDTYKYTFKTI